MTSSGWASKAKWQVQTDQLRFGEQTKVAGSDRQRLTWPAAPTRSASVHQRELGRPDHAQGAGGLIVFMVLIVVYLSIAFEWKMAVAAFVALSTTS